MRKLSSHGIGDAVDVESDLRHAAGPAIAEISYGRMRMAGFLAKMGSPETPVA